MSETALNADRLLRRVFAEVLASVDAKKAVMNSVRISGNLLFADETMVDLDEISGIYAIAIGKASCPMATGLIEVLGEKFTEGIFSAAETSLCLLKGWRSFHGGHPEPNEDSFLAARAAIELLERIDDERSLVFFMISGGGSAMFEMLKDQAITLDQLKEANRVLVTCGATIAEINAIRRRLSVVKGGGLSRLAPRSKKVSLIVSDTNSEEPFNVASGPTIANQNDLSESELQDLVSRYDLASKLPPRVTAFLEKNVFNAASLPLPVTDDHVYSVLMENRDAIFKAKELLASNGFAVQIAENLAEQKIVEGCVAGLEQLFKFRQKEGDGKPVAIVSGGEFMCPVRGRGTGGRNLESALRTAILFDEVKQQKKYDGLKLLALFAGTDGIDGNSPAAGAVVDDATLERGRKLGLNALEYLENSDSHTFFDRLGDTIVTGTTGTNVRDVRILLAF